MNITQINGTTVRSTPAGFIATKGTSPRELYFLGTSVEQTARAQKLLATHSFDRLFKAAKSVRRLGPNVRVINLRTKP